MKKNIKFGIGFLAGRPNVCNIINYYYKEIIKQGMYEDYLVNFTMFILVDLNYQSVDKEKFYNIEPEVYKHINIKYITPEDIQNEKDNITKIYDIKKEEIDLLIGKGYGKARNAIMYFALKDKIDYLLFWDDDEYPIANIKNKQNEVEWKEQTNVLEHLKNIINANVTVGYRCGNMSPIPAIDFNSELTRKDFKNYIDAVSNEAISWKKVKKMLNYDNGIKYADENILKAKKIQDKKNLGKKNWLLGSGICINLQKIDKVPPFYNPPEARGEDAFFSTWLTNGKVLQVPTYHFHDGFLKYTEILNGKRPKTLVKVAPDEEVIGKRFLDASIGWIKYKPLLVYISQREKYTQIINKTKKNLKKSISKINKKFKKYDFSILLEELEKYDLNVQKHYDEYLKTYEMWARLKNEIKKGI